MTRFLLVLCSFWIAFSSNAYASPKSALGGGVGFPGLLHVDYHRWISSDRSVEVGLTPLVYLNVGVLGLTQHVPLSSSTTSDHNLVASGVVMAFVGIMDGSPAFGPGARVGYEWLAEHIGISVALGGVALFTTGGPTGLQPMPDVRVTLWHVRR